MLQFQALRYRRFQHGFHPLNLHRRTRCWLSALTNLLQGLRLWRPMRLSRCGSSSMRYLLRYAYSSSVPSTLLYRRKLKFKAKSESGSSHLSFKRLVLGAFSVGLGSRV